MPPSQYVDDFDDDGLDDDYDADEYGDAEGMTAEDEASMAEGTAAVRKELGKEDSNKVTLKQIQDALWNYYYDVPKSVSYLRKTFIAPPPAKPAPKPAAPKKTAEGMFRDLLPPTYSFAAESTGVDQTSPAMAEAAPCSHTPFPLRLEPQELPLRGFFHDMPWLRTPLDRHTQFVEAWRPSGGLLGGGDGSGMTKLQKLAAARKKKAEDQKQQEKTSQVEKSLERMHVTNTKEAGDTKTASSAKRQKLSPESTQPEPSISQDEASLEKVSAVPENKNARVEEPESGPVSSQAEPSAFARTLFGSAPGASRARAQDIFPMPSTQSTLFSPANFSQPSPDDVVFEAQSKGSGFAKAK